MVPERKEVLKKDGGMSKGHKSQSKGASSSPELGQLEQENKN